MTHRRVGRRRGAAALSAVAALLTTIVGCGLDGEAMRATPAAETVSAPTTAVAPTDPATTSVGTTAPTPGVATPTFPNPDLAWSDCGGGFECTTMTAPLDHSDPDGPTIDIALERHPAASGDERIGPLFFNPGGPGGVGLSSMRSLAVVLPDTVLDRFDLIGMDPRGIGQSSAIDCDQNVAEAYSVDPTIEDEADREALLTVSQRIADDCEASDGAVLPHLGTRQVAHDIDLARRALGDEQITYVGVSYGTVIGQVYATEFPDRVRAMALDGVVDLTAGGIEGARSQAEGFESALQAFADDCFQSDCPLGNVPLSVVDEVMEQAERAPIPNSTGGRPAGPAEVVLGMVAALYGERSWDQLADALAGAAGLLGGRPDGADLVALADRYVNAVDVDVYFAVSCLDSAWPGVDELLADAKVVGSVAPHFGEALVTDYVRCSLWPVPPDPIDPPTGEGLPPIVLVATTGDPATPLASAEAVAEQLPTATLLTYTGTTHGVLFNGVECIDDPVTDYLVELTVPAETACR